MFKKIQCFVVALAWYSCTLANNTVLVKDTYPQAYNWYVDVAQKYPQAQLKTISFAACTSHHADDKVIFFPKSILESINQNYAYVLAGSNVSDKYLEFLYTQEYLLLHEAYHANNAHMTQGKIASALFFATGATITIISIWMTLLTQPYVSRALIAQSVAGNITLASCLIRHMRLQERDADHFANQTASKQALTAGIAWHESNYQDFKLSPQATIIEQKLTAAQADLHHPSPMIRKQRAEQVYKTRFN
ncbi:hypothetical protein KBD08_03230 [Candidatus Babeliales bacterium]|nr:hypothetical protein [Candidatus Babeliales bacterium]